MGQHDENTDTSLWAEAVDNIVREKRRVLVFGATDTGKSTLCRMLVSRYLERGIATALIDCDVGQSTLGPPTTIGMKVYAGSEGPRPDPFPDRFEFVGSTTPERHLLQSLCACGKCVAAAEKAGAQAIVLDTTGLVHGPSALALKLEKVRLYEPDAVLALQRGREMGDLVAAVEALGCGVVCLGVSSAAEARSSIQRRAARRDMFHRFFERGRKEEVPLGRLRILPYGPGLGENLDEDELATLTADLGVGAAYAERCGGRLLILATGPNHYARKPPGYEDAVIVSKHAYEHMLVGLVDDGRTVGLGIILEFDAVGRRMILLASPPEAVPSHVAVGSETRVLEDGTELAKAPRPRWLSRSEAIPGALRIVADHF